MEEAQVNAVADAFTDLFDFMTKGKFSTSDEDKVSRMLKQLRASVH